MSGRRAFPLVAAAVALVAMAPFLRTAGYDFINFDDYDYRYLPRIESGLGPGTLSWGLKSLDHGIWMPLTWCSYALDVSLFGGTPGGMHLHNVILHGLCAGLLFLLLESLLEVSGDGFRVSGDGASKQLSNCQTVKPSSAAVATALGALFWAWHPLRVESVAWISSRKDILSFFFELLALLAWVGHLKSVHGREWFLRGKYWLSFLFFALATMAKPSAMTFPVIAALLDVFVVRGEREGEKWRWRQYMPLLAYAAFIAVLAQRAQALGGAVGRTGAPLWWRVINAVASYGVYLLHTAWPSDLAMQCVVRWPELPRHLAVGVVCVAAVGAFMAWRVVRHWGRLKEFRRVDDWTLAGLAIFTLAVGPFLGIASFGYHAYADRFTYVPSLGLCVVLLGVARRLSRQALRVAGSCFAVALLLLGGLAWRQTGFWENEETLFRRTLQVDGEKNGSAYKGLIGYHFEMDHDPVKVVEEYGRLRQANEELAMDVAHLYLLSLFELGRGEKGGEELLWYQRRLFDQLERDRVEHHQERQAISASFRMVCAAQAIARGEYELAEGHFEATRAALTDYPFCDYLEGVMHLKRGNPEKALAAWRRIRPRDQDPYIRFRWLTAKLPADDVEALKILPSLAWKTPLVP